MPLLPCFPASLLPHSTYCVSGPGATTGGLANDQTRLIANSVTAVISISAETGNIAHAQCAYS